MKGGQHNKKYIVKNQAKITSVLFDLIRYIMSTFVLFSLLWCLVLLGPFCLLWSYSVHLILFSPLRPYSFYQKKKGKGRPYLVHSIHFGLTLPIRSSQAFLVLFSLLWSYSILLVHFYLIRSSLVYSVHSLIFGPFDPFRTYLVNSVHFVFFFFLFFFFFVDNTVHFGLIRSIQSLSI